jgi:hypothetical protein
VVFWRASGARAVAIVFSHDGGVQLVACRDGVPTYWDHVPVTGAEV